MTAQDVDGNASDSVDFNGTISQWSYQPAEHYNGTVYVTYDVTDGIANTAASSTFDLAAVNDVPDLTGTKAVLNAATEDTVYIIEVDDLLTGYTDADTGGDSQLTSDRSICNEWLYNVLSIKRNINLLPTLNLTEQLISIMWLQIIMVVIS